MREFLISFVVVGILAAVYAAFSTGIKVSDEGKILPPNVPRAAVWAGGSDGGVWILIRPTSEPRIWNGQVYDESGRLWAQGKFWGRDVAEKYQGKHDLPLNSFDGTKIFIEGSVPLYPIGRHEYPVGDSFKKIVDFPNPGPAYESEARKAEEQEVLR